MSLFLLKHAELIIGLAEARIGGDGLLKQCAGFGVVALLCGLMQPGRGCVGGSFCVVGMLRSEALQLFAARGIGNQGAVAAEEARNYGLLADASLDEYTNCRTSARSLSTSAWWWAWSC